MDTEIIETYKEYRIVINSVPEQQFDFDDFGWAFQVSKDNVPCLRMVIKTANSRKTDANKKYVLTWGRKKIHALLDMESFEKEAEYCYEWIDVPSNLAPKKVNCQEFLMES
jgi:hypothetical protein